MISEDGRSSAVVVARRPERDAREKLSSELVPAQPQQPPRHPLVFAERCYSVSRLLCL